MAHETATLASYVADLKYEDIPPEVLDRAKVLTLDTKTNQILTITAEYGPVPSVPAPAAAATPTRGPRAPMIPYSFQILAIGK